MNRNLKYKIKLYNEEYHWKEHSSFYATDVLEIIEMNKGRKKTEALYHSILDALQAGFVVGYSAALEEMKKGGQLK